MPSQRLLGTEKESRERICCDPGEGAEDDPGYDSAVQQEVRGFSVEETVIKQIVSSSNNDKCKINNKVNKNRLLHNVIYLQNRVNNLN